MILFDDENMRVLYDERGTSTLVITFAPRSIVAHGEEFWARGALGKVGVSAVGFMPKGSNWFVPAFMEAALDSLNDITPLYDRIILYGGSAGAYAAAKWSRRLTAQYSICLGPQWSIDPAHVGDEDRRFAEYFTPAMAGMELTAEDIDGKVYVLYDPHHEEDAYHAGMVSGLSPDVELVLCPYMHHSVVELFAGTRHMSDLLDACRGDAKLNLIQVAARIRRRNKHRLLFLLAKLSARRPEAAVELCLKYSGGIWREESQFVDFGDFLASRGHERLAGVVYAHGLSLNKGSARLQAKLPSRRAPVARLPSPGWRIDESARAAAAVSLQRLTDCGPTPWWFVHHPDGFVVECGVEQRAVQLAMEINAGRIALRTGTGT